MATILKNQTLTFIEWLREIRRPKRQYYEDIGGSNRWIRVDPKEFYRNERVFCTQGRTQKSNPFVVECPESNCRILIQSNGGVRGAKMDVSWLKKKK